MQMSVQPMLLMSKALHCKGETTDTDKETISVLFKKLDKQENSPQNHVVGFCVNKQTVFSVMQYKSGVNPLTYKKFKETEYRL